jgi:hypothetical protein
MLIHVYLLISLRTLMVLGYGEAITKSNSRLQFYVMDNVAQVLIVGNAATVAPRGWSLISL